MRLDRFPFQKQYDLMDCGPACMTMILRHHGNWLPISEVRSLIKISNQGVTFEIIEKAALHFGLEPLSVALSMEQLINEVPLPCIAHIENKHFVVIYKISNKKVWLANPAIGKYSISIEEFKEVWLQKNTQIGACMLFEKTLDFNSQQKTTKTLKGFSILLNYLIPYKPNFYQIALALLVSTLISLLMPFLTRNIVDYGIVYKDVNFVVIILLAQLFFFLVQTALLTIRNWIVLHIISRINYRLVTDFLVKLFKLPITYFTTKQSGDLIQRIFDHQKINEFIGSHSVSSLFSLINVLAFTAILFFFDTTIALVFLVGTILYFIWILLFLKKRKKIDYEIFHAFAEQQSILIGIFDNMEEIILNGSQKRRKNQWQSFQRKVFRINLVKLRMEESITNGSSIINQSKNILIIFLAALGVIEGQITLGTMLAIQYIISLVDSPIKSISLFITKYQDAKFAIERLNEIHNSQGSIENGLKNIPYPKSISFDSLCFNYGISSKMVLNNISFETKINTVTAIVGPSGAGKTTLIKLLLKYFESNSGTISVDGIPLDKINTLSWRDNVSCVLQNGTIFEDSIENNITESKSLAPTDTKKLKRALELAKLDDFVEGLPLGIETIVGNNGYSLSGGEAQRILIARTLYKEAPVMIFDEATSSLDSENERDIVSNLKTVFKDKIVIIIAHRLSTIKNADQIIVLDNSRVIEKGTHLELLDKKGRYYELIKNQI